MCALTALVRSPFSGLSLHNNVMVERTARARAVATFHLNGAAVVPRGTSRSDLLVLLDYYDGRTIQRDRRLTG